MEYKFSKAEFDDVFNNNKNNIRHRPGHRFLMFPFTTKDADALESFTNCIGNYLCLGRGIKPQFQNPHELVERMKEKGLSIEKDEDTFENIIETFFYKKSIEDGEVVYKFKPINLNFIEQNYSDESTEKKNANFAFDVLGDPETISKDINEITQSKQSFNALEKCVEGALKMSTSKIHQDKAYYKLTHVFDEVFNEDFNYVIHDQTCVEEYFSLFFDFYIFNYCSQSVLLLDRFTNGNRNQMIPLYYSIQWEKTNQNRKCYTNGWRSLERKAGSLFAHANALEMLNQTEEIFEEPLDYITLEHLVETNQLDDQSVALQIDEITNYYRSLISDVPQILNVEKDNISNTATEASIKWLYKTIRVQFENSQHRGSRYNSYAKFFEKLALGFLKNRGRSGRVLNISEELLIFLTKICIKDKEQIRLVDLFSEFERRGVFLDNSSKNAVSEYYEKLNVIEKKSDSGDAKYVRKIL